VLKAAFKEQVTQGNLFKEFV